MHLCILFRYFAVRSHLQGILFNAKTPHLYVPIDKLREKAPSTRLPPAGFLLVSHDTSARGGRNCGKFLICRRRHRRQLTPRRDPLSRSPRFLLAKKRAADGATTDENETGANWVTSLLTPKLSRCDGKKKRLGMGEGT